MKGKVRVPVAGTVGKAVIVDPNATPGATLGVDLHGPDGRVLRPEEVLNFAPGGAPAPSAGVVAPVWRFIREVPGNVRQAEQLDEAGVLVRFPDGSWSARDPLDVEHGGTGRASLEAGALLFGGGTGPVTAVALQAGALLLGGAPLDFLPPPAEDGQGILSVGGQWVVQTISVGPRLKVVPYADPLVLDWSDADAIHVVLEGDPLVAMIGAEDGQRLSLSLEQGGLGGHQLAGWSFNTRFPGDPPELAAEAGHNDRLIFHYNEDGAGAYDLLLHVSLPPQPDPHTFALTAAVAGGAHIAPFREDEPPELTAAVAGGAYIAPFREDEPLGLTASLVGGTYEEDP